MRVGKSMMTVAMVDHLLQRGDKGVLVQPVRSSAEAVDQERGR